LGEGSNYNFDLLTLLRISDLDIRKVARNNLSLTVGEYYKVVVKLINRIPMTSEALNKIVSHKAADYDFRGLQEIKYFLDTIGHSKLSLQMDEIIHSGKMGHVDFAGESARKILPEFNDLSKKLMAAQKAQESETVDDANEAEPPVSDNLEHQMLKTVIMQLEHEESTRKLKVLAIDDAPLMLQTISSVLSNDYKVYRMTNPTMLEKFLSQITPELFLLDYKMPVISGFELVPIIRNFPEHKNTPIIFLTSMGTADYFSAALALGACDYIVKPFQPNILREKVAKHIVRKKQF